MKHAHRFLICHQIGLEQFLLLIVNILRHIRREIYYPLITPASVEDAVNGFKPGDDLPSPVSPGFPGEPSALRFRFLDMAFGKP